MEIRKRDTYRKDYQSTATTVAGNPPDYHGKLSLFGRQRTVSEGHPVSLLSKKTGLDIGGNFDTERWYAPKPARFISTRPSHFLFHYRGPVWPCVLPGILTKEKPEEADWTLARSGPNANLMDQRGTTAIARVTPTNAIASVATSLGELREGLPSIPGKTTFKEGKIGSIGSEYLNLEFAIKPTLADIAKFKKARLTQEKKLAQLYRDSGRMVRRRYTFPPEVSTTTVRRQDVPYVPPGTSLTSYEASVGDLEIVTRTENRFSFSGAFTYFMPKQEGFAQKMSELDAIYGIYPDAEALWNLMPWSWAIDWVSNTGDLIQNLTSFSQDGLVLRYGYIMCHTLVRVDMTWTGNLSDGDVLVPDRLHTQYRYERKQRRRATPYGFGLDFGAFTPRQIAIIAALGMSGASGRK